MNFLELTLKATVSCLQWVLGMKNPLQENQALQSHLSSPNAIIFL